MAVKIGPLIISKAEDTFFEGSMKAVAETVVMEVIKGMNLVSFFFSGEYNTATAVVECSYNEGKTYMALMGANTGSGTSTSTALSAQTNTPIGWEAAIPPGVTHVRARCTILTSGTINVKITQGAGYYEPVIGLVNGTLSAAGAVIGGVFAPGQWTDISSTNLTKGSSMATPGSVDLAVVATATAFTNTSIGVGEVRLSATANCKGTLYLEVSRDNALFKKIKSVELAQAVGCEYYAEIVHKPSVRWVRAAFTNGFEADQTFFMCQMMRVGIA